MKVVTKFYSEARVKTSAPSPVKRYLAPASASTAPSTDAGFNGKGMHRADELLVDAAAAAAESGPSTPPVGAAAP